MQLESSGPVVLLPDSQQHTVLRLGLHSIPHSEWLYSDEDLGVFHRHKLDMAQRDLPRVFRDQPDSLPAQLEFAATVRRHLLEHQPAAYRLEADEFVHRSGTRWPLAETGLWHSSLWIPEDICLLQASAEGYRLTAASLCSPSNWQLADKTGRSLDEIHAPVPRYGVDQGGHSGESTESLAARVNRLLARLPAEKALLRYNWSIQPGNELHWWGPEAAKTNQQALYWRVERQTLRRLPETGAIVFAIRIFLYSFAVMRRQPGFSTALTTILEHLPDDERQYKSLQIERIRAALNE